MARYQIQTELQEIFSTGGLTQQEYDDALNALGFGETTHVTLHDSRAQDQPESAVIKVETAASVGEDETEQKPARTLFEEIQQRQTDKRGFLLEPATFRVFDDVELRIQGKKQALLLALLAPAEGEIAEVLRRDVIAHIYPGEEETRATIAKLASLAWGATNTLYDQCKAIAHPAERKGATVVAIRRDDEVYYTLAPIHPAEPQPIDYVNEPLEDGYWDDDGEDDDWIRDGEPEDNLNTQPSAQVVHNETVVAEDIRSKQTEELPSEATGQYRGAEETEIVTFPLKSFYTVEDIMRELGVAKHVVRRALKEAGIQGASGKHKSGFSNKSAGLRFDDNTYEIAISIVKGYQR